MSTRKTRFRNAGAGKGVKARLDPSTLEDLYCRRGLSQAEIARRYECSAQFVSVLLREYGLRPTSPAVGLSAKSSR